MIAKLLVTIFMILLFMSILWVGFCIIAGFFGYMLALITGMSPKISKLGGWTVITFMPFLLLSKKGRKRLSKEFEKFN